MNTALAAVAAALVLLATPARASAADDVTEARALYDQGAKLFHAGKYREAIGRFEAAYRLKPHGAIHFNVAQCHEKLAEWPAALRSYQDYLRELPEARDRAAVRAAMGRIEQRLAAAGVQALLVYTDPPGAAVRIDGKPRGRTPFHITLPPGAYRVGLSLDAYAAEEQDAEVNLASSRVVEVVLRPRAEAAVKAPGARPAAVAAAPAAASSLSSGVPVSGAPPAPPTAGAQAQPGAAPAADLRAGPAPASPLAPAPPPPPGARPPGRVYAWVAAGTAVVAAAAGVWYGAQAQQAQDSLQDGTVHADADALAKEASSKAKTANVLYGVSGVAAAAGVTLFFVEGRF